MLSLFRENTCAIATFQIKPLFDAAMKVLLFVRPVICFQIRFLEASDWYLRGYAEEWSDFFFWWSPGKGKGGGKSKLVQEKSLYRGTYVIHTWTAMFFGPMIRG